MVAAQRHRGPDDEGQEFVSLSGATLGMGQRRLSIQDLSPNGHQPMIHPETGDILVFNGEMYDVGGLRRELEAAGSRFRGHSDTEVILHAMARWGPDCLSRFNGMYAIIFYHKKTNTLTVARDPIGIKPLYYAHAGDRLLIASEVRAILASGAVTPYMSLPAINSLLAYGAVQEPLTFFKTIRAYPPGTWTRYRLQPDGTATEDTSRRFWKIPEIDPALTSERAVPLVRQAVEDAVRDQLISDVPVGVFLSSGLDSTIIAGLACRHTSRLRTLTVGFAMDSPELSESGAAEITARQLGVEHQDIQISSIEAERSTVEWLNSLDQPSVDGLNTYVISKAVRKAGIVVALSGLGGDELFGGYPSFEDVPRFIRMARKLSFLPPSMRFAFGKMAALRRGFTVREKAGEMLAIGDDPLRVYLHRRRLMSDGQMRRFGLEPTSQGLDRSFEPIEAMEAIGVGGQDLIADVSRFESRFYMGNMLLRDTDTNGMAHSLEIRPPFLDQRVLDLAYRIPGSVRMPDGLARKQILRQAFPDLLRPELLAQPKRGFWLPIRRWMIGPLRPMCEEALGHVKSIETFRPEAIDDVWNRFCLHPDSQVWSSAFMLCVLGCYMRQIRSIVPKATQSSSQTIDLAPMPVHTR